MATAAHVLVVCNPDNCFAVNTQPNFIIRNDVLLSDHTTIGLGGRARYFVACQTVPQIRECLTFADRERIPLQVLGGGSNIIFADEGFPGLVLRVDLQGVRFEEDNHSIVMTAAAGEIWDDLVTLAIDKGLAGIECLSGIPGLAGATPIQNVGAYGQEVRDTIVSLKALDRRSLSPVEFAGRECKFAYRQSRFKGEDADRYVITEVSFCLTKNGRPTLRYPELSKYIEARVDLSSLDSGKPALAAVRHTVLTLRRRKSMVIDSADPNSRSVGSFFMNPILRRDAFRDIEERWKRWGEAEPIPTFPAGDDLKVPAAWLVEHSGFHKGFRKGGIGISPNHALALINCGGTTNELLKLAGEIQAKVFEKFGIRLEREPVVVRS